MPVSDSWVTEPVSRRQRRGHRKDRLDAFGIFFGAHIGIGDISALGIFLGGIRFHCIVV